MCKVAHVSRQRSSGSSGHASLFMSTPRVSRGEGYAVGVIEVVTRDVEVTIAAADLDAVEGEQAVVLARNEGRELRGADFDAAAVWRDDERARRRSLVHVDPVVLVERLTG